MGLDLDNTCFSDSGNQDDSGTGIPRLIMQTWKTTEVPDKWKPSVKSIKKYMPGWRHILTTDEDNRKFVKENHPDFLKTYDGYHHPIQRADAVRYMWLYKYGGIYMDLDYEIRKPLDHLFKSNSNLFFTTSTNFKGYITNSFMASKPKQKIWLDVLEEMKRRAKGWKPFSGEGREWWSQGKHLTVIMTTGPGVIDYVVRRSSYVYTMLPPNLINPYTICDTIFDKDSYLQPLEGCSWGGLDTLAGNYVYCNLWQVIFIIGFIIIFLVIIWALLRSQRESR